MEQNGLCCFEKFFVKLLSPGRYVLRGYFRPRLVRKNHRSSYRSHAANVIRFRKRIGSEMCITDCPRILCPFMKAREGYAGRLNCERNVVTSAWVMSVSSRTAMV